MATGGAQEARREAAGERRVADAPRRLRALLELRQQHLRARIAACEELTAAMAALRAALSPGPEEPEEPGP